MTRRAPVTNSSRGNMKQKPYKRMPFGYWRYKEHRVTAVRALVKELGKPLTKIRKHDFEDNGLSGLLGQYGNSYKRALEEAGCNIPEATWKDIPHRIMRRGYWDIKEHRVAAIRHLVARVRKFPADITATDFRKNGLDSVLSKYDNCCFLALKEAGYRIEPWEMRITPKGYWHKRKNCIRATKFLVKSLDKDVEEITQKDFFSNSLGGMLMIAYNSSPYLALKDAGFTLKKQKRMPTDYWRVKENRAKAVRGLVEELGKKPEDIRLKDFENAGLLGLLNVYDGYKLALVEAGYDVEYSKRVTKPLGYWGKKENRVSATKELVRKLNNPLDEITPKDFKENGFGTLLSQYLIAKCAKYERGEMFPYDEGYLLKYPSLVKRALAEAELIR